MWRNCRPSIIENADGYGPAFVCFQLNNRTGNYEGTEFIFSRRGIKLHRKQKLAEQIPYVLDFVNKKFMWYNINQIRFF
jgi:hypothetical protein